MSQEPATPAMFTQVKGFTEIHILLLLGDTNEYTLIIDNVLKLFIIILSKSVCPPGWKEFKGHCYGFVPKFMSFPKAKNFCVKRKVSFLLYYKTFFGHL